MDSKGLHWILPAAILATVLSFSNYLESHGIPVSLDFWSWRPYLALFSLLFWFLPVASMSGAFPD